MHAINHMDAGHPRTLSMELLVNFCRTVLRPEEERLREAMEEYARTLVLSAPR